MNKLPTMSEFEKPSGVDFAAPDVAMARWNQGIRAASDSDNTISVLDVIGQDIFGEGVTAKRIGAALRKIDADEVVVNINSPGGDVFEGLAIMNLLREDSRPVTVNVLGLAASAASIVAMAGNDIRMGDGSFMMIHNVWVLAIGDRNVLRDAADKLESFDDALAGLYSARAGNPKEDMQSLMNDETFFSPDQAVEIGLADGMMAGGVTKDGQNRVQAVRVVERSLASNGYSRKERDRLIWEFKQSFERPDESAGYSRPGEIREYLHS